MARKKLVLKVDKFILSEDKPGKDAESPGLCITTGRYNVDCYKTGLYLAALAALYLTLVSECVGGDCHFRILTQGVTFETSDPSDIWSV